MQKHVELIQKCIQTQCNGNYDIVLVICSECLLFCWVMIFGNSRTFTHSLMLFKVKIQPAMILVNVSGQRTTTFLVLKHVCGRCRVVLMADGSHGRWQVIALYFQIITWIIGENSDPVFEGGQKTTSMANKLNVWQFC